MVGPGKTALRRLSAPIVSPLLLAPIAASARPMAVRAALLLLTMAAALLLPVAAALASV